MRRTKWIARRRSGFVVAACVAACTLVAVPAASAAKTRFGAKLNSHTQPSASKVFPWIHPDGEPNTGLAWHYRIVGAAGGNTKAPRDGKITKIKALTTEPDSIRLELARVRTRKLHGSRITEARITRRIGKVSLEGQRFSPADVFAGTNGPYRVETVNVPNTKVKKGERLAFEDAHIGPVSCLGGAYCPYPGSRSPDLLEYRPLGGRCMGKECTLQPVGGPYETYPGGFSTDLLIQAVMK
jgi:hypothetical protein